MLQTNPEQVRRLGNGPNRQFPTGARALGNTNPIATSAQTLGLGRLIAREPPKDVGSIGQFWGLSRGIEQRLEIFLSKGEGWRNVLDTLSEGQRQRLSDYLITIGRHEYVIELKRHVSNFAKPSGEIVLLQRITNDWNFNDSEISRVLGFESEVDIRSIFNGRQFTRTRDLPLTVRMSRRS
jgi:hypothetical protein